MKKHFCFTKRLGKKVAFKRVFKLSLPEKCHLYPPYAAWLFSTDVQCTPSSGQNPLYTWTVERWVTSTNQWRPELSVCVSASSVNSTLIIPPNTLWYGTYRVNVTVSASSDSTPAALPASVALSSPVSTHLTVVPTPLVATVVVTAGKTDFYANETVSLDMSGSRDPDVTSSSNTTGMKLYLFCHPQQTATKYATMTFDQKLAAAQSIATNKLVGRTNDLPFFVDSAFPVNFSVWILVKNRSQVISGFGGSPQTMRFVTCVDK